MVRVDQVIYVCPHAGCNQTYKSKYSLQRHLTKHMENSKPFKCNVCGASFALAQYLKDHMNGHKGLKPYKCSICDKSYT